MMAEFNEVLNLGRCVALLRATDDVRRATAYQSPKFVIKATRLHRRDRRERHESFVVTIGRPNFRERLFIKAAKKAGEPFPVRQIQLTFWPKRKRK